LPAYIAAQPDYSAKIIPNNMNDLLFYALIIALLYYFFLYLPAQKSISSNPPPQPFTHNQATQTDSEIITYNEPGAVNCPGPELESTLDILIKDIQALNRQIK
jgi:hypothetical protein